MTDIANLGKWEMIFFFSGPDIVRACNFREFETLREGRFKLAEFSDQQVRAVYVAVSGHKAVQSLVFFSFPVDAQGQLNPDWNTPLQRLADTAGRGPNMGGGRIRLACRSQCPISWHQNSLWDPVTSDFSAIRRVVTKRIGKVEAQAAAPRDPEQIQRQYRNDAIAYKNQIQEMQQEVERQKVLSAHRGDQGEVEKLKRQLRNLQQTFKQREEGFVQQLTRLQIKNRQLNDQLKKQDAPALEKFDLGAQLAEMVAHEQSVDHMQNRVELLEAELAKGSESNAEDLLGQVQALGGVMVVYHPGAGHINVPISELEGYLSNPMAVAAQRCSVPESHYRRWLAHQDAPECLQCHKKLPMVNAPSDFVQGQSDYCKIHQQLAPLASSDTL